MDPDLNLKLDVTIQKSPELLGVGEEGRAMLIPGEEAHSLQRPEGEEAAWVVGHLPNALW